MYQDASLIVIVRTNLTKGSARRSTNVHFCADTLTSNVCPKSPSLATECPYSHTRPPHTQAHAHHAYAHVPMPRSHPPSRLNTPPCPPCPCPRPCAPPQVRPAAFPAHRPHQARSQRASAAEKAFSAAEKLSGSTRSSLHARVRFDSWQRRPITCGWASPSRRLAASRSG